VGATSAGRSTALVDLSWPPAGLWLSGQTRDQCSLLERKLKFRPEGDPAAFIQVDVLPDHFSDPEAVESVACGLDRLRCRVLP